MFRAGPMNLITDIEGIHVGNASDARIKSGTTAVLFDRPAVAGVQVLGGAPGTRETDLLEPHNLVDAVHALVLSGGSAYGLDAASGVQGVLRERGIGFAAAGQRIPIVPAAILFDLVNGGAKDWGRVSPYRALGEKAAEAATRRFSLGSVGAGTGATTARFKGGLGSASTQLEDGTMVGALVAVNPRGSATIGSSRHFWAAPFEIDKEFGGLGWPEKMPADASAIADKFGELKPENANTTIGIIATDASLSKAGCKRLAIAAHSGFSRAIWPSHTPVDGDLVFGVSIGDRTLDESLMIQFHGAATATMARAIARAVYAASPEPQDTKPAWSLNQFHLDDPRQSTHGGSDLG